ncbi:DNA mismatch repair protein MutS [Myxococcota bacterium]|nr:DNA mismatch repair protein MutS [Myxococcota bacterium]MBU1380715.1 DNA mismatch repair protein MutS [Myxococcota bacterium]MBU1498057.1 DNA mismatch repair protein MutS [Myxococcota bacterium]
MTKTKANNEDLTPLMRQYMEHKEKYPDCLLLFRVGDFYELFYEDACMASEALGLVLTSRDKNKENPVPLCGVPHHALKTYLPRLLDAGFKVAVCEQVEDPKEAKGIVRRDVTRVVTPGLILDEEQLDARSGNYIAVVYTPDNTKYAIAAADISTGEFKTAVLTGTDSVFAEIARIRPRQLIVPDSLFPAMSERLGGSGILVEASSSSFMGYEKSLETYNRYSSEALTRDDGDEHAVIACSALMTELSRAHPADELPRQRVVPYVPGDYLVIDETTITSLELFQTARERKKEGSLISVIDRTTTGMGGRRLRSWLLYPLLDIASIRHRQDAVEILFERADLRKSLIDVLKTFPDIERLASRISHHVATPRDMGTLRSGLENLPVLGSILDEIARSTTIGPLKLLTPFEDVFEDILNLLVMLVDEPPVNLKDGGIFRKGVSSELDELLELAAGGKDALIAIEEREKKRSGINSLKVKFNRVFGYYIEVPRARTGEVPSDYMRKQTLANAERFVTPELAELESKVLTAQERQLILEEEMFTALRREISLHTTRISALADFIATVDVLASFAQVAHKNGYCRPEVNNSFEFRVTDGRHAVIEIMLKTGEFIPNDMNLSCDDRQVLLITGPNMAGKSTVIRQLAIMVLLAQTGSFIPARKASIGICDRIFSRVGASDNIARGDSTFMVEMKETAAILRYATRRSLLILDEIGRGTSTWDGVSIAWSVVEHIHDHIGARTLFATHYHELSALAQVKPRVCLGAISVREWNGKILFLRKLIAGSVNRSYGIQVAQLAGVPDSVIARSRQIIKLLEDGESLILPGKRNSKDAMPGLFSFDLNEAESEEVTSEVDENPVILKLKALNPDDLSPKSALDLIYDLLSLVKE